MRTHFTLATQSEVAQLPRTPSSGSSAGAFHVLGGMRLRLLGFVMEDPRILFEMTGRGIPPLR